MHKNNLIFNIGFGLATFIVVLLFYKNILLTTGVLAVIAIIGLVKWKSLRTLKIFIFVGIFGTLAEIVAIKIGIWDYSITKFLDVPLWLFLVWGNAGAFIHQISKEIKERKLKCLKK